MNIKNIVALVTLTAAAGFANAATYTFNDLTLASGNSYTQGSFSMNATASNGGVLAHIGGGQFAGLWLGQSATAFGSYQFSFSQNVTSIEVQFDALSSTGGSPEETISNFATNHGTAMINYYNLDGTTFSNNTVHSITNDGRGLITFAGPAFSSFSFDHAQNPSQNGFVIERITITTSPVPEAETYAMLLAGLGALGLMARRRKSK